MNTAGTADLLDVVIVGAGFSGLCMAYRLKQAGLGFVLLEQAGSVGGTWRDNVYPGSACDVPSNLYCFSFAPKADWSRRYPRQHELHAYLDDCADRFGLRAQLHLGHRVESARFDPASQTWCVIAGPQGRRFRARSLVIATGGLSQPRAPDIDGFADFAGQSFHSARWDIRAEVAGKRVGVIGTGASAIQIVPELAKRGARLSVFQRTPAWVLPKRDPEVPRWRQQAYRRWPRLQRAARTLVRWQLETRAVAFTRWPWLLRAAQPLFALVQRWQVRDPALRRALRPEYVPGCKRVLLSSDYYPSFDRGDARLVTPAIRRILPEGVETADGEVHALDMLVACTGFHAAEAGIPFPVHGRDGLELNALWKQGASAYRGTQVSGFPNLFLMTGPNTGLGHSSVLLMIEAQAGYVLALVQALRGRPGQALEPQAPAQARYNGRLQRRLARTVWNTGGCRSWYRTESGLNTTLWPGSTPAFARMLSRIDWQAIEFIGHSKKVTDP